MKGGSGGKYYATEGRGGNEFKRKLGKESLDRLGIKHRHAVDRAGLAYGCTTVRYIRQRHRRFAGLALVRVHQVEPYLPEQKGQDEGPGGKQGFRPHSTNIAPNSPAGPTAQKIAYGNFLDSPKFLFL